MFTLQGKRILILSPQNWGKMFVSKHHYAIELARRGNTVYFLDPPEQGNSNLGEPVRVTAMPGTTPVHHSGMQPDAGNLYLVRHKLWFPYILKFHALPLFHAGMRRHLKKVLKAIGEPIDIVWSFDLGNLYPLKYFPRVPLKIFHPVDEPLNPAAFESARGADVIFSVTTEILDKYKQFGLPAYFINHGVGTDFLPPDGTAARRRPGPVRIGFSGNLLRNDIDRPTFLQIVRENPAVQFECWGSYKDGESNIGGVTNDETRQFIAGLQSSSNVVLHGPVPSDRLAKEIHGMDGFLICYDIKKDQSAGTNYHKVMEYMSTGKVIVSNNITTYRHRPDLVQMIPGREDNQELPALFRRVAAECDEFNSPELISKRIAFARDNTYQRQVQRIEAVLDQLASSEKQV